MRPDERRSDGRVVPPERGRCGCGRGHGIGRRRVLVAAGSVGALALAGCVGGSAPAAVPDPVAIGPGDQCDVCGMIVADHPGPIGELYYADHGPTGHDPPARFDSLAACLFPYHFERERRGWGPVAVYVTDYSAVDYVVDRVDGTPVISSHPEAAAFSPADEVVYVVGSRVRGSMGPDFVPFADGGDARSFRDEYGGHLVPFDDIGPSMLGR